MDHFPVAHAEAILRPPAPQDFHDGDLPQGIERRGAERQRSRSHEELLRFGIELQRGQLQHIGRRARCAEGMCFRLNQGVWAQRGSALLVASAAPWRQSGRRHCARPGPRLCRRPR